MQLSPQGLPFEQYLQQLRLCCRGDALVGWIGLASRRFGVGVAVGIGVLVGGLTVGVGVAVGIGVLVGGLTVGVGVAVGIGVLVGGLTVGVGVAVGIGVLVGGLTVGVGVAATPHARTISNKGKRARYAYFLISPAESTVILT